MVNKKHLQVLLVEDNPGDARLIEEMLKDSSRSTFQIEVEVSLQGGIERALTGSHDAVLLDLFLPDSRGLETFARFSEVVPGAATIVLTGLDDEQAALAAVHDGAQDFLVKGTVDGQVLLRAIHYAIERKRFEQVRWLDEARLEALLKLSEMSEQPEQAIIEGALDAGARLTGSEIGFMHFTQEKGSGKHITLWKDGVARRESLESTTMWMELSRTKKPKILNDLDQRAGNSGLPGGGHPGLQRYILVPLVEDEKVAAIVGMGNKPEPYDQADVRQLSLLMGGMWSLIQRKRLREQTLQRAEQLAAVNALGAALADSLELDQICERLFQASKRLFPDTATMFISLFDAETRKIRPIFGNQDGERVDVSALPSFPLAPLGMGTQSQVINTRKHLVVSDLPSQIHEAVVVGSDERLTQSALYVPMLAKYRTVGVVQIQSYASDRYSEEDAHLLSVVGNTAAVAIENSVLFTQTQRRLNNLNSLKAIERAIAASTDLDLTLSILLEHVVKQLCADAADVLMLEPRTQMLTRSASVGFASRNGGHVHRLGEGHAGRAARERKLVTIPDLRQIEEVSSCEQMLRQEGFISYAGAPLVAKGQVKGVLDVYHRSRHEPDAEWLEFFSTMADQAAIAIENIALFQDLERSNTDLRLAYDATIEGWARALELRDSDTEGHTQRVASTTLKLAQHMGMDEDELVHVYRGALLHDIGKMAVPDSILLKPGPLTDEEWQVMRQHPAYAYRMLSHVAYLKRALDIPYAHHEKWDGSGYPRGLKGEEIPLAARIFAIIDVCDALTSDRPYRKAWPREKARAYLVEQAGTHFDPHVVEVFMREIAGQKFSLPSE